MRRSSKNKYKNEWGLRPPSQWKQIVGTIVGFIILMILLYAGIVLLWATCPDPFYG